MARVALPPTAAAAAAVANSSSAQTQTCIVVIAAVVRLLRKHNAHHALAAFRTLRLDGTPTLSPWPYEYEIYLPVFYY